MKQSDLTARLYSNKSLTEGEYREYLRATWEAIAATRRQLKGISNAMTIFNTNLMTLAKALDMSLDSAQFMVDRVKKDDKFGIHVGSEAPEDEQ